MKTFISAAEIDRLDREAFERGELLANVMMPRAPVGAPAAFVLDEYGRSWRIPPDATGLAALHNQFRQLHGRLSSAVDATFFGHGRLNELRMLAIRCCEGEPINVAHRALQLGPAPAVPQPPRWPAEQPWPWNLIHSRQRREVEAEDARMRAAGYLD